MPDREPPTFLTLVDRLTKPHPEALARDHGTEIQTVDGLLQQLRGAIFLGLETGGAGAAFGSRLPLDATATDLLEEIDRQAAEVLMAVQQGPTPYGTTEAYVRRWAGQTTEGKLFTVTVRQTVDNPEEYYRTHPGKPTVFSGMVQYTAMQLVQSWVDRIEDLFNPPSTREIRANCPACDARYVFKVKDGHHQQSAALNFVRDSEGRTLAAKCSACSASWGPPQFEWLARHIGAKPLPELSTTAGIIEA